LKWWPFHRGHYLLNKGIDLLKLFNEYDHNDSMDMIDSLIVDDSVYDDKSEGNVVKKRAALNKDYGRIGIAINDERASDMEVDGEADDQDRLNDGSIPSLDPRIPMMGM
jgi:hypothetical protein